VTVVHGAAGPALAGGGSVSVIAAKAMSSVVTITATGPTEAVLSDNDVNVLQGTGMIIDDRGDILTNNHVVAGSVSVTVNLHGSLDPVPAYVVGTDPSQDIALVRLDDPPPGLVPVIFGNSDSLVVGDGVVAIGDSLGLSAGTPTVTSGIVSALGRTVGSPSSSGSTSTSGSDGDALVDMIQTDAPINPGNSGGPLLDSAGRVIGMNTELDSSTADNTPAQDISFAIPSARLISVLGALEKGTTNSKAMLGVQVITNTPELKSQYGLGVSNGAVVVSIDRGSSADQAGLKLGDVIVGFNSVPVTSSEDLETDVQASSVGRTVTLRVWRQSDQLTLTAVLQATTAAN
ncbi:MAG: trypsin-like peptidase domain-containing protein, partial [Acidimicrobiales bacterium]